MHHGPVTTWIMTRPDDLGPADQASLGAILTRSPELTAVTVHVRAFAAIMTGRRGRELEQWMTSADATGEPALKSFVTSLRADQDAFMGFNSVARVIKAGSRAVRERPAEWKVVAVLPEVGPCDAAAAVRP